MQLARKISITKQDLEVAGNMYEAVDQFIYSGSQINSKNLILTYILHGAESFLRS